MMRISLSLIVRVSFSLYQRFSLAALSLSLFSSLRGERKSLWDQGTVYESSLSSWLIVSYIIISVAEWTDPSRKCSIKFSMGLPQPSYAFVSDMTVWRNTSQSQARQTCTQARQTNHKSLVAIFLLPTPQNLSSRDLEWRVTRLQTNQHSQCKIATRKKQNKNKTNGLHFKTRPALGLGRVIRATKFNKWIGGERENRRGDKTSGYTPDSCLTVSLLVAC